MGLKNIIPGKLNDHLKIYKSKYLPHFIDLLVKHAYSIYVFITIFDLFLTIS